MSDQVTFRVSSSLKSVIGRELITDDFIAVFELVKNSFDAHATRVDLIFDSTSDGDASITIQDNGKGMNRQDILQKWMFVAYSAKKEGTEDYRDKIAVKRIFAGAKGIGRFSCDKLGRRLELFTRKASTAPLHKLTVNWDDFEESSQREFIDIPATLVKTKMPPRPLAKGTLLKITGLRELWDRQKLLLLKRSLEKLINPNQGNDSSSFKVFISAPAQKAADKLVPKNEPWNKVNGSVRNFLFESLSIKTTSIEVVVPDGGEYIETTLQDRGRFIYKIKEHNELSSLRGVHVYLFALNTAAKSFFTKSMGVHAVQYGSVFLFKNGFRIYPFGEEGEDSWGIDRRKAQGFSRFLGTRDLIGRVELNGDNPGLKETSSRDGGLIRNHDFAQLRELFIDYALKRLERYAVDIIKFGNEPETDEADLGGRVTELVGVLTRSKQMLDIEYNPDLVNVLKNASEKSLKSLVKQFARLAASSNNPQLDRDIKRAAKRLRQLEQAKDEAEAEVESSAAARKMAEREAEEERKRAAEAEAVAARAEKSSKRITSQNRFLQAMVSADVSNLVGLHHHIGIAAGTVLNHIQNFVRRVRTNKPVTTDMMVSTLEKIAFQAQQISSTVRFATKANFKLDAAQLEDDIATFIHEYVDNTYSHMTVLDSDKPIKMSWQSKGLRGLTCRFRPIEIGVLLDNLVNNSRKAGAKSISFDATQPDDKFLRITIRDDGRGIDAVALPHIFEMGYTTTNGSGLGLFHAAKIATEIGGGLTVNPDCKNGAEFVWEIRA